MSRKKKAAIATGVVIGSTGALFGAVLAINTLLDSQKTSEYAARPTTGSRSHVTSPFRSGRMPAM